MVEVEQTEPGEGQVLQVKRNKLAIWSFVLSLAAFPVGIFTLCLELGVLLGLLAVIFGVVALIQIRQEKGQLEGRWFAIAGVLIATLITIIILYHLIPERIAKRKRMCRIICISRMHRLAIMMYLYTHDYEGKFPMGDKWCDLLKPYAESEYEFYCPLSQGQTVSYGFNKNLEGRNWENNVDDTVMLFEIEGGRNISGGSELLYIMRHEGKGCTVAFVDGHVEFVKSEELGKLRWKVEETNVEDEEVK